VAIDDNSNIDESNEGTTEEDEEDEEDNIQNKSCWRCLSQTQVVAMVSNFSTSYNVVNVSLALPILNDLYPATSSEDAAACASSLLAGMIIGQIVGGALGDSWLGRLGALRLVMVIQIVASLGSATIWKNVYVALAIWRFFLGIGAGAVYPLSATLSAEAEDHRSGELSSDEKVGQLKNVLLTFSMQGVGFITVPIATLILLFSLKDTQLDLVWRILLGIGCFPGIVLMILQFRNRYEPGRALIPQEEPVQDDMFGPTTPVREEPLIQHDQEEESEASGEVQDMSLFSAIGNEPYLIQKLVGTAATWFLFDVLFYGNTLFQPIVMEAAFGSGTSDENLIKKAATDSLLLGLIALPGYVISAVAIGRRICTVHQTPRYVQLQGFAVMAVLYSIIGAYWSYLKRVPALLVTIYGLTFFFANYGPNTTTFIFPSLLFSHRCRSSLNGISAAGGKLGALIGASLFEPAASSWGDDKVMLVCAGISVVAFGLTTLFTKQPNNNISYP